MTKVYISCCAAPHDGDSLRYDISRIPKSTMKVLGGSSQSCDPASRCTQPVGCCASHSPVVTQETRSLSCTSVRSLGEHKGHESRSWSSVLTTPCIAGWCPYCHHSPSFAPLWHYIGATHHVLHYYTVYRHVCACCQSVSAACAAINVCASHG
jgi:hypothetical protein